MPALPAATRAPRFSRSCLLLAVTALLGGCLLFEPQIGWRSYSIEEIEYDEGVELVRRVTTRFMTERFGGLGMEWDPELGNLEVDPVYDDTRRLRLRIHLEEREWGIDVEMFAVVHHLVPGAPGQIWGKTQQDVPLEEMLYDALLTEYLEQRSRSGGEG